MKFKIKTITLKKAHEILENASAVIWCNGVCYPSVCDFKDVDENIFLILKIFDGDDYYFAEFTEGYNQEVKVVGSSMFLIDSNKQEVQVSILVPENLEELYKN